MEWISVKDQLPNATGDYLCVITSGPVDEDYRCGYVGIVRFNAEGNYDNGIPGAFSREILDEDGWPIGNYYSVPVVYWMRLPGLPEGWSRSRSSCF